MELKKKHAVLIYEGKNQKMVQAVKRANDVLADPEFYNQIRNIKKFEQTLLSSFYVAKILEECGMRIRVTLTSPFSSKESHALSTTEIVINRWHFKSDLAYRVNTLIHYTVDAVSLMNKNLGLSKNMQGRNAPPKAIGGIAESMARTSTISLNTLDML